MAQLQKPFSTMVKLKASTRILQSNDKAEDLL